MGRTVLTLAFAASALATALPAVAASTISVDLNHSRRIMLSGAAANVVIANPAIADVAMTDAHSIVVSGRGFGSTELIVTDHAGHLLLDSNIEVIAQNVVNVYNGPNPVQYGCLLSCDSLSPRVSPAGSTGGGPSTSSALSPGTGVTVTSATAARTVE